MIIVRDILRLEDGKENRVNTLWNEAKKKERKFGYPFLRLMTGMDSPGTVILEVIYEDISEFRESWTDNHAGRAFQRWYNKFRSLTTKVHREVFQVLD